MKLKKVLGLTLSAALAVSAVAPWTGMTAFAADGENQESLTASPRAITYFEVTSGEGGIVEISSQDFFGEDSYTVTEGETENIVILDFMGSSTFSAIPNDGYEFDHWEVRRAHGSWKSVDWDAEYTLSSWDEWKIYGIRAVFKEEAPVETTVTVEHYDLDKTLLKTTTKEIESIDDVDVDAWQESIEGYTYVYGDFDPIEKVAKLVYQKNETPAEQVRPIFVYKDGEKKVGESFNGLVMSKGVHNFSEVMGELTKYCPEGYEITVSGDFYADQGKEVEVAVTKVEAPVEQVRPVFVYKDGEEKVGEPFNGLVMSKGVHNFSEVMDELTKYCPEGYVITTSGDFYADQGVEVVVGVEKVTNTAIVNIRYMDGDTFVAGGDYPFEKDSSVKFGDLILPEGYELDTDKNNAESGFVAREGAKIIVHVKKVSTDVIMNIRFMYGDEFIAGGDYFVPAGVQNYSILEKYVPEGYKMAVSGDFMAADGAKLEVPLEKSNKDVIMNIRFMDGDEFVAGGDYFLPEGVQNYNILTKYVPEGYMMEVAGDFYVEAGRSLDVPVKKITNEVIMKIRFMDGDEFVAGGDYFLPAGVQNYKILDKYVPDGYRITEAGDFYVEEGRTLDVPVEKIKDEKPDGGDDNDGGNTYYPSKPDGDKDDDKDEEITDPDTPLVNPSNPDVSEAVPGNPEDGDPAGESIDDEDVAKTDAPPQTGRKVAGSLALLAGAAAVAAVTLKKRED